MRRTIFVLILLFPFSLFAQEGIGLKLEGNLPMNYEFNSMKRKVGINLELNYSKAFNPTWGIQTGLMPEVYWSSDDDKFDAYAALDIHIPLLLSYRIKESLLFFNSGILLDMNNILIFGIHEDHSRYTNPELPFSRARSFGISYCLDMGYRFSSNFSTILRFRTPIYDEYRNYGLIGLGVQYSFKGKEK